MATVFWDAHSIMFIDCPEENTLHNTISYTTLTIEHYAAFLNWLNPEIKEKIQNLAKKIVLFDQDNAIAHKGTIAMVK